MISLTMRTVLGMDTEDQLTKLEEGAAKVFINESLTVRYGGFLPYGTLLDLVKKWRREKDSCLIREADVIAILNSHHLIHPTYSNLGRFMGWKNIIVQQFPQNSGKGE